MGKWEIATFDDVLTIINGKNQKQIENSLGKYPIYGSGGVMGYADDYLCKANTVVIGRKGTINKPIYVEEPFWNVDTAFGLQANDALLLPKFLFYFCEKYDFESLNTTVTIPSLTKANLLKIKIPLPPLDIQQKIADVLDKASALIELRRTQLEKLDLLIKSQFIEMFGSFKSNPHGWRESTVGKECYYIKDGPHKSPPYVEDGTGIPFISTRNVVNGDGIDWSTAKYISEADYEACIKKCKPEKGNILYSKGGTTGIAKLVDTDRRFANWVHVAVLKFGCQIDGKFFECMLNMDYCYEQSQRLTKGIANRDFVLSAIAQVKIYVPPIELQRQFTTFVQQVDQSKFKIQQSLSQLELNYKSLIQKYFRGELF